ncbi:MAG: hypothetical protein PHR35_04100 [Kiritimatiellae bacterium]|nr:hypothetical protein [Kiritimatiellia bacterium]
MFNRGVTVTAARLLHSMIPRSYGQNLACIFFVDVGARRLVGQPQPCVSVRDLIEKLQEWAATFGDNAAVAIRTLEFNGGDVDDDSVPLSCGITLDDSHRGPRRCVLTPAVPLMPKGGAA